jgi:hypothetical protein
MTLFPYTTLFRSESFSRTFISSLDRAGRLNPGARFSGDQATIARKGKALADVEP